MTTPYLDTLPHDLNLIIIHFISCTLYDDVTKSLIQKNDVKSLYMFSITNKYNYKLCRKALNICMLRYFRYEKYCCEEALGEAVLRGRWNDAKIMIDAEQNNDFFSGMFDVNFKKKFHPLASASYCGHLPTVKLLLNHKNIKVNSIDQCGYTPMWYACDESRIEVMKLLLEHGADVNIVHGDIRHCRTILYKAVLNNNIEAVKFLIDNCYNQIKSFYCLSKKKNQEEEDQIVANESKKQQYVSLKNRAKNNSRDIYKLLLELEGKILEEEEERSDSEEKSTLRFIKFISNIFGVLKSRFDRKYV